MRSSSLSLNGHGDNSPHASPVNSPTRLAEDSHYNTGGPASTSGTGLQHSTSLRRKKSNNTSLLNTSNSASAAAQYDHSSHPVPTSPLPSSVILNPQSSIDPPTPTGVHHQQMPTSSAGDITPLPPLDGNHTSSTQGQSSSTSASQIMNESMRPATAQVLSSSSAFAGMPNRPATATDSSSSSTQRESREDKPSSSSSRAGSAIDNPYKSFRVTLDDPCHKVLPAALKKYKINDDWRQYALFICYGTTGEPIHKCQ